MHVAKGVDADLRLGAALQGDLGTTHIEVTVRYATYDKVNEEPPRKDKARKVWKRVPMPPVSERLVLAELSSKGVPVKDSGGLRLAGQVQALTGIGGVMDGTQAVSVFLVNRRPPDESPAFRDRGYVFQVELSLRCAAGFVARPDRSGEGGDFDNQIADLQYRGSFEYGVGHGIAVEVRARIAAPEGAGSARYRAFLGGALGRQLRDLEHHGAGAKGGDAVSDRQSQQPRAAHQLPLVRHGADSRQPEPARYRTC